MKAAEVIEHLEVQIGVVVTVKARQKRRKAPRRERGFIVFLSPDDRDQKERVRRMVYDLLVVRNITAEIEVVVEGDTGEEQEAADVEAETQELLVEELAEKPVAA